MLAMEVICYIKKSDMEEYFESAKEAKAQWPHAFLPRGVSEWGYITDQSLKSNEEDVSEALVEAINWENESILQYNSSIAKELQNNPHGCEDLNTGHILKIHEQGLIRIVKLGRELQRQF